MTSSDTGLSQHAQEAADELVLGSQLQEMERLPVWVEALATRHHFAESVTFGINLCLEEVVSNVIRHGYGNQPGQYLTIRCTAPGPGFFLFTVEDEAAPFDPLSAAPLPKVGEQDPSLIGGQGLRLLRGFADSLEYEPLPAGNRIHIGFSNPAPPAS